MFISPSILSLDLRLFFSLRVFPGLGEESVELFDALSV